jgi:hypothetical protein
MSNSRDEESRETNAGPDKSYAVGNKKPPLHSRFQQGKSGNPSGRPKGRTNFDATLLKEFYKPVSATINGKPIKVTNDKLFAASLVKDGITKGPQSKLQLANRVERAEARLAAEAEVRKKPKRRGRSPSSNGPRRNSVCTRRSVLPPVSNPRLRGGDRSRKVTIEVRRGEQKRTHHGQDRSQFLRRRALADRRS